MSKLGDGTIYCARWGIPFQNLIGNFRKSSKKRTVPLPNLADFDDYLPVAIKKCR